MTLTGAEKQETLGAAVSNLQLHIPHNYWVSAHVSEAGSPSVLTGERRETPTLLGPLERLRLNG
jgi:hypothetical protein